MLTFLFILFLKRHYPEHWLRIESFIVKTFKNRKSIFGFVFLPLLFILSVQNVSAQKHQLNYKVIFRGDDIGWMRLEKNVNGSKSNLSLTSEIKTRIIFSIDVFTKELSTFENGKLIYSSLFRKNNGSVKVDKQTKLIGDLYEISEEGEKHRFKFPLIDSNLLSLYFEEPVTLKKVYWDKKNCFLDVTKTEDGGYLMKFSNGNCNRFYYKNGVCTKVKIEHMFYSAEIVYVQ